MIYFIQANLYLALLGICYHFIFRKLRHFKFGRPFLLFGVLMSLLLPLIEFHQIQVSYSNQLSYVHLLDTIDIDTSESGQSNFSIYAITVWIYCLVVSFLLSKMIYSLTRIYLLKLKSTRKENYYELANSSAVFSFFKWIFIGSDVPSKDRMILYKHEEIHSKAFHSVDVLFIHLVQVLFWFNPIVYVIRNCLVELHEFEADQKSAENKSQYIELLINYQLETLHLQTIHQFNSNYLKNRIMRIKQNYNAKIRLIPILITLIVFFAFFAINQNLNSQEQAKNDVTNLSLNEDSTNSTYASGLLAKISDVSMASGSALFFAEDKHYKDVPDDLPGYQGGYEELSKFIAKHLKYNTKAKENEIEGMVYIEFIVEADGSIKDPRIAKGLNKQLNKNALEIIKKMPKWIPAKKDSVDVAAKVLLPIRYSTDGKIHNGINMQEEKDQQALPRKSKENINEEEQREFEKYLKDRGYKKIERSSSEGDKQ